MWCNNPRERAFHIGHGLSVSLIYQTVSRGLGIPIIAMKRSWDALLTLYWQLLNWLEGVFISRLPPKAAINTSHIRISTLAS